MAVQLNGWQGPIRYASITAFVIASAFPCMHAHAAAALGSLIVGATVEATCMVSGTALGAGIASRASVAVTGPMTFTCTAGSAYAIGLSGASNRGGATFNAALDSSLPARQSGAALSHAAGTTMVSDGTGTGSAQTVSVAGLIATVNDNAPDHAFGNVITATINF